MATSQYRFEYGELGLVSDDCHLGEFDGTLLCFADNAQDCPLYVYQLFRSRNRLLSGFLTLYGPTVNRVPRVNSIERSLARCIWEVGGFLEVKCGVFAGTFCS